VRASLGAHIGLNAVCPYYTMFPISFPLRVLAHAGSDESVLDPFCGRGTTVFAARLLNLRSVGIDASDVAVAIARAKLATASPDGVIAKLETLLTERSGPVETPEGEFWRMCFHAETLSQLCRVRLALLETTNDDDAVLLRAILLGILHGPLSKGPPRYLSNQMPRTYAAKPDYAVRYWRREALEAPVVDLVDAVLRRAKHVLRDQLTPGSGSVVMGDARKLGQLGIGGFTRVVTSPPYFGMRTYRPDQWLRHWLLGGDPTVEYSTAGMIPTTDEDQFVTALAEVWRSVALVCKPGARMAIRFGALPSAQRDHERQLKESLRASEAGWRTTTIRDAGSASDGKRQAMQFGFSSIAAAEIDLYAVLESSHV
jgi:SAM-dependent methyltransferase